VRFRRLPDSNIIVTLRQRVAPRRHHQRRRPEGSVEACQRVSAMVLVVRHYEVRVVQAHRIQQALPQNSTERRSFDPREQDAEQVSGGAVAERDSRLIDERQRRQSGDPLVG